MFAGRCVRVAGAVSTNYAGAAVAKRTSHATHLAAPPYPTHTCTAEDEIESLYMTYAISQFLLNHVIS